MGDTLNGYRAFVTGSSSGIGAETARWLAGAGASIVLHGRDAGKLGDVESELRSNDVEVNSVIGAIDTPESARRVADEALSHGSIDILVNNVGGGSSTGGATDWFGATPEEWEQTFRTNVLSTVTVTHAIAPGMIERGWGRIIQTASAIVDNPIPVLPDYKAAKSAVVSLTISLAIALRGTGVTANAISPGFTVTEGLRSWLESEAPAKGWGSTWDEIESNAAKDVWPALVPRMGRTEDIARAVLFLAEPGGEFITGQHLRVDGGLPLAGGRW